MKITRQVKIGNVFVGGGATVSIQSMTNTKTSDIENTIVQIKQLAAAGCQIVRCAVPDMESARSLAEIKANVNIPVVADIHYDYKLALAAIESGVDKIRINPGNIGDRSGVSEIVKAAKKAEIPMRIGINGGSLEKDILEKYKGVTPVALVESALRNIALVESFDFHNIVVSIKTSDVKMNFDAHKILSDRTDYPLHIGITEAGIGQRSVVKSAVGIGSLLLNGIGDTIRVSLTGDPVNEVIAGKDILSVIGFKQGSIDIISCPTCGRTEVDLEGIAQKVSGELRILEAERISEEMDPITVAVMGCSVNGPGEARGADFGVACGKDRGVIFKKGEIIKTVYEKDIVKELIDVIKDHGIY